MKILSLNQFNEKLKVNQISSSDLKDTIVHKYHPKNKNELRQIIKERIKNEGPECDLNDIDVSNITDMYSMFRGSKFNGDISKWDVSNVTYMYNMFCDSYFDGVISQWDVSNVMSMTDMFSNCPLENNPPEWYKDKHN